MNIQPSGHWLEANGGMTTWRHHSVNDDFGSWLSFQGIAI
jgi:hypothetical protein